MVEDNKPKLIADYSFKDRKTKLTCKRCGVVVYVPYIVPPDWVCSFCTDAAPYRGYTAPNVHWLPVVLTSPFYLGLLALSGGFFLGWVKSFVDVVWH